MLIAAPARWGLLICALAVLLGFAARSAEQPQSAPPATAPVPERNSSPRPKTPQEAAYFIRLEDYRRQRKAYEKEASAYWDLITDKRQLRRQRRTEGHSIGLEHYVLDQPPVYRGPSEPPPPPSLVKERPPAEPGQPPVPVPVLADFLEQAKAHFGFEPEAPASEAEFKRAYAQAAVKAGIAKNQAVRIYGFEASGNGRYDVQAGLEASGPKRRAISTALGYNQLLVTNTLSILAEHDDDVIAALKARTSEAEERRARIEAKLGILKQMIRFAQSVPKKWSAQDELARTPKAWGVHALNLDIDIGPLLQAQKLADSLIFAERKGYTARLTAAELEMMNLMGDGSGYDVISMPEDMRPKVPTANMFQRGGYERNTIVRKFNTVSSLLSATDAKMDGQTDLAGAKEMEAAFEAVAAQASGSPMR
jgi:hypothetical protein